MSIGDNIALLSKLRAKHELTGYLAPEGFIAQVKNEISDVVETLDHLVIAKGPPQRSFWSQNIWRALETIDFTSIKDAADKLKERQKMWALYPFQLHRRAALIQDRLPSVRAKALKFPHTFKRPLPPLGSWTLISQDTLLASADCTSPFPNGELEFEQDRTGPPSRAYLKLFEVFTRLQRWPKADDFCIELGASPGGWTWVLDSLKAKVLAVDRSELAPQVMQSGRVTFRAGNAFSLVPSEFDQVDWMFSDLACYPEKLLEFLRPWLSSGKCRNFVCTLKFQGDSHYEIAEEFASIDGSELIHLNQNKHELTWIKLDRPH